MIDQTDNVFDLNAVLHPGTVFDHPRDVVAEPEVLFRGGPVGTDGALAVGALRDPGDPPVGWRPVAGPRSAARSSSRSTRSPRSTTRSLPV